MTDLGRGVTLYNGRGGLSPVPQEILYCVVTRLEIGKVKTIVRMLDPSALHRLPRARRCRSCFALSLPHGFVLLAAARVL
jgi:uncharacterized membrane-anchored protein YitT (DUF2179 family)